MEPSTTPLAKGLVAWWLPLPVGEKRLVWRNILIETPPEPPSLYRYYPGKEELV